MAPTYDPDDEDTQEHQVAPRYPDAAPAAGEVREQAAHPSQPPAEQSADAGPAAPWSAPTAPWPASGQQWQQTPQSGEPWQQQPAQPWQQSPQQPPQGQWQQPPQGQWQAQGQQTGPPGWSAQPEYAGGGYASSPLVTIAAIVLLVFGLLTTLIGALGVAVGGFFEQALREARQQGAIPGLEEIDLAGVGDIIVVAFVIVLIIGILHLASAVGIFMHKQWARILGIVLAVLGTLIGVLGLVGGSSVAGGMDGSELAFPIAIAVGYGFSLFALIAGNNHFRRRYTR